MKEKILVSACLIGRPCRYDGSSKEDARVVALGLKYELIPVCPEELGGLPTPRACAERCEGRVVTENGRDVTREFLRGAELAAHMAKSMGAKCAVLKAKSPSCGCGKIYDGTFSGTLVPGDGVTAAMLINEGFPVYTEEMVKELM